MLAVREHAPGHFGFDEAVRTRGAGREIIGALQDVWGSTHIGSNVLEAVIRALRKKLGERAWMIETVRGMGYRLRVERPDRS